MGNLQTIVTTDLLTEGIHFDLVYTPLKHLGYKAIIVNLSDVYAMNAIPTQILVSIAISSKFTTEMVEELYEGIHAACNYYGVDLVGGDTSSSLTGLTISVTAIGAAPEGRIVYRSGAKENDLICVTGNLGAAYIGLQLLEREKRIFDKDHSIQPDLTGYDYVLERQLKPEARKEIINILAENEILPTSMIDISDGLSSDLLHICDASNKGCKIYIDKIPVAEETRKVAEELNMEPFSVSINGGEDYELLFTVSLEDYDKIASILGIHIIGHITSEKDGCYMVLPDGSLSQITALGWNSLKAKT
jgi:thiamine-monophosphate kinase